MRRLREVLGDAVHQAGSLVAPDRLRFDFTHHGPVKEEALAEIEARVNRGIWAAKDVVKEEKPYKEAVASGAMALFGEKYGDVVRVITIPGLSVELCGGTHVRNTAEISLFHILSETGVAAGIRRIEAATGKRAYDVLREREHQLRQTADVLKATPETAAKKAQALLDERRALEKRLDEAMKGGGDEVRRLIESAAPVDGIRAVSSHGARRRREDAAGAWRCRARTTGRVRRRVRCNLRRPEGRPPRGRDRRRARPRRSRR